ncbi:MAG: AMP-binding protein [Chloroflexota bacterium]
MQTEVRDPIPGVVYPDKDALKTYLESGEVELDTLANAFKQSAQKYPNNIILNGPEGALTGRQLDEMTDRLALALSNLGLKPKDRVIFQLPNSNEIFIALIACFKAQVIPLCTLHAHRRAEIGYLGKHASAVAHFIATDSEKFDFGAFATEMREAIPTLKHAIVARGDIPAGMADAHSMQAMIDAQPLTEAQAFVQNQDRDPLQVGLFQLSGGSTGIPKIIPRFNYEYVYQLRTVAEFNGYVADEVFMLPTPVLHNANMGCMSLPVMLGGGTYLVAPEVTPQVFLRMLVRHRPTMMGVVGPLLDRFQELGISKKISFSVRGLIGAYALRRLRGVISMNSGAQAEATLHVAGLHVYGMTEGLLMFTQASDPKEVRDNCVGRPVSRFDEVRIVDPETLDDVPFGETGECWTKGPYTIRGFFDAEELNQDSFVDGFYRTGDLLSAREVNGKTYYAFEGRIKDVIDRGGEKINCQEIERVLVNHPAILSAALVAMPDRAYGERACAFVTLKEDVESLELSGLTSFLDQEGLAKYKWPERLKIMHDLPVTHLNKPDKMKMREMITEELKQEGALV